MQNITDKSKMDQISHFLERIDDDQDGQLKVDDVLKVLLSFLYKFNLKLTKFTFKKENSEI